MSEVVISFVVMSNLLVYVGQHVIRGETETKNCAMSITVTEIKKIDAAAIDINAMLLIGKKNLVNLLLNLWNQLMKSLIF